MDRRRTAILISGRGSNMAALIEAARDDSYPAEIVAVLSNRPEAEGLARATVSGIATAVVDHKAHPTREAFEEELHEALVRSGAELVCLAGFMRRLTASFVERWSGRLLNIHPSLLPAFPGLDTHARALAAGVRIHGCTVHVVTPEVDAGPIVAQAAVAVAGGDTPETLATRVLAAEHRLYPLALSLYASGRARLAGGRVVIEAPVPEARFIVPAPG